MEPGIYAFQYKTMEEEVKEKRWIIITAVLAGLLAAIMADWNNLKKEELNNSTKNIKNSQVSEGNKETKRGIQGEAPQDEIMPFADEQAFQALKEIYEEINFSGKFKKGNQEVYDYYKDKYAKLLNGKVKITTGHGEKYDWEFYGHDIKELTSTVSSRLYYFDMDEDCLPELCIASKSGTHVFKYIPETDEYQIWLEELKPGGNITGSRKIKSGTGHIEPEVTDISYIFYTFNQYNISGDLDYWIGFGIDGYDYTPIYMVSWPVYENETKRLEIPKEVKKQSYIGGGPKWKGYYFRVTKEQYEQLTGEYFKADMLSQWQRVPVSYFLPEFERVYGSWREFPFNMSYAEESTVQILEKIYGGINFYSGFDMGKTKYYEKYKEKYKKLLTGEVFIDSNENKWFLEDFIYDLDVLKNLSTRLYYFDMDGDNQPELCIETTSGTYVFKYIPDKNHIQLWWYIWGQGYEIAGKRQIRHNGESFHVFYERKEDGTENFNVMFGAMNTGDGEDLYIISLPCYQGNTANPEIPEDMIKQGYISMETGNYFFRVTKEQYEKLTKEYFETEMRPVWSRVPFSYFFPEE